MTSTIKPYIVVIHQPACSNVLFVDPTTKSVLRLKQLTADYCEAYGHGYADARNILCLNDTYGRGDACEMYAEALGWLTALRSANNTTAEDGPFPALS